MFTLILLATIVSSTVSALKCGDCECISNRIVHCAGSQVRALPRLPSNVMETITVIVLRNTYMPSLSNDSFVGFVNLKTLNIVGNRLLSCDDVRQLVLPATVAFITDCSGVSTASAHTSPEELSSAGLSSTHDGVSTDATGMPSNTPSTELTTLPPDDSTATVNTSAITLPPAAFQHRLELFEAATYGLASALSVMILVWIGFLLRRHVRLGMGRPRDTELETFGAGGSSIYTNPIFRSASDDEV